jgi:hypothetical protein
MNLVGASLSSAYLSRSSKSNPLQPTCVKRAATRTRHAARCAGAFSSSASQVAARRVVKFVKPASCQDRDGRSTANMEQIPICQRMPHAAQLLLFMVYRIMPRSTSTATPAAAKRLTTTRPISPRRPSSSFWLGEMLRRRAFG